MSEFKMPSLGADMEKGTLLEWKVKPGDHVRRGDVVAVVDTEKAAVDVEIWESGTIDQLLVQPKTQIPVGAPMALFHRDQEEPSKPMAQEVPVVKKEERVRISPRARKLASEAAPKDIRSVIAAAMSRSKKEIPHYYLLHEIDMSRALQWMNQENEKKSIEERLVYSALLVKAVALAAKEVPEMNGFYTEGRFKPSTQVHVGMAISLRTGGLIAPALFNTDQKKIDGLMKEMMDLISRARAGSLRSSELSDSTLTVTNLGEQSVDAVFGVIYPPQVALIGFGGLSPDHKIKASLAADHRVSDGHRGSVFISRISQLLQNPENLI